MAITLNAAKKRRVSQKIYSWGKLTAGSLTRAGIYEIIFWEPVLKKQGYIHFFRLKNTSMPPTTTIIIVIITQNALLFFCKGKSTFIP